MGRLNFIYRMKFVAVLLVSVFILQAQGWPFSKREVYPTDAELAEYLARIRDEYDQDIMDLEYRPKRFGRYGNKYADNKYNAMAGIFYNKLSINLYLLIFI